MSMEARMSLSNVSQEYSSWGKWPSTTEYCICGSEKCFRKMRVKENCIQAMRMETLINRQKLYIRFNVVIQLRLWLHIWPTLKTALDIRHFRKSHSVCQEKSWVALVGSLSVLDVGILWDLDWDMITHHITWCIPLINLCPPVWETITLPLPPYWVVSNCRPYTDTKWNQIKQYFEWHKEISHLYHKAFKILLDMTKH